MHMYCAAQLVNLVELYVMHSALFPLRFFFRDRRTFTQKKLYIKTVYRDIRFLHQLSEITYLHFPNFVFQTNNGTRGSKPYHYKRNRIYGYCLLLADSCWVFVKHRHAKRARVIFLVIGVFVELFFLVAMYSKKETGNL